VLMKREHQHMPQQLLISHCFVAAALWAAPI
jgi:hypothetical protein